MSQNLVNTRKKQNKKHAFLKAVLLAIAVATAPVWGIPFMFALAIVLIMLTPVLIIKKWIEKNSL